VQQDICDTGKCGNEEYEYLEIVPQA